MKKIFLLFLFLGFFISNTNAQWQQTNGPFGGSIYSILIDGSVVIVGTEGAGMFMTTDNGTNWNGINTGITDLEICALTKKGSDYYAGTYGGGVFKSTDNGVNWTAVNNGLTNTDVTSIIIIDTNIFIGTFGGGVFMSNNDGSSWNVMNSGLINKNVNSFAVCGSNIYAATFGGLFKSTNNGASWSKVTYTGLPTSNFFSLACDGINIFAGTSVGVFLSTNNGVSWTAVNNGLTNLAIQSFAINGTNVFAGTNGGAFITTNNGTNWTAINSGMTSYQVKSLATDGTNLYAGTSKRGLFLSIDNGISWANVNNGIINTTIRSLAATDSMIYAGTLSGAVYRTSNSGASWTMGDLNSLSSTIRDIVIKGSNIFAGTYGQGVFVSTDNGDTWNTANIGMSNLTINCMAVSGTYIYAGTSGDGISRSMDDGANWVQADTVLTSENVRSLLVTSNSIFAGTNNGLFVSNDYGLNWILANIGDTDAIAYSLANQGANIFAGTNNGIYRSTNNGLNWTLANNGIPAGASIGKIIFDGSSVLVVADDDIYLSNDNGDSWSAIDLGTMHSTPFYSMCTLESDVFIGTTSNGVWKNTISNIPSAPVVTSPITYCQYATAAQLTATGSNLLWYTSPTGGTGSTTAPIPSTSTVGTTSYYVSQTVNGIEGPRATINVDVIALPSAPAVTTPVTYCQNATATQLTATGSNLLWYTTPTGGTGNGSAPIPSTGIVGTSSYYVSQTVNECEGTRATINVIVNALPATPVITQNGDTLYSDTSTGNQWYYNNNLLTGETNQELVVTNTGDYFVIVTQNGCSSDTSNTITAYASPNNQSYNLVVDNITDTSFDVSWTSGSKGNSALFVIQNNTGTALPVNNTTYVADNVFGNGDQIGVSGWYCAYNGFNTNVTVTGLTAATTYRIMACAYTGTPGNEHYNINIANDNPVNVITNISTSIESYVENDFIIYPNPVNDMINISLPKKSNIDILNAEGQIIKSILPNGKYVSIDISVFARGLYFVKVKNESGVIIKKFVKE